MSSLVRVLRQPSRWPRAIGDSILSAGQAFAVPFVLVWQHRAVVLHVFSILGGWGLVTWGIAALLDWLAGPDGVRVVVMLSAGIFLLSLAGWRHLGELFGHGLYRLHRVRRQIQDDIERGGP